MTDDTARIADLLQPNTASFDVNADPGVLTIALLQAAIDQINTDNHDDIKEAQEAIDAFWNMVPVRLQGHPEVNLMARMVWASHLGAPLHPKHVEQMKAHYQELLDAL